jgi:GTP-binding protein HflX
VELAEHAKEAGISTIIFDDDLRPSQQKNLEELFSAKIIDRSRLILDIFARRARTREGILQVERAQLAYYMPRITAKFGRFEQQTGGIGTRGPGERKIEVDLRRIRDRMVALDREIDTIKEHREVARAKRIESGELTVAIAGYTNAGKSTLLNKLSGENAVYADDKLFATLDPTTRRVQLPGKRKVLFTDTVGFIRKLPHALVAAFRATLEEISQADCIIHLVDASHAEYAHHISVVNDVLKELGAQDIPTIVVYNKADALTATERKTLCSKGEPILISAKTGEGTAILMSALEQTIVPKLAKHTITLKHGQEKLISKIHASSIVKKQIYKADSVALTINCTPEQWKKVNSLIRRSP